MTATFKQRTCCALTCLLLGTSQSVLADKGGKHGHGHSRDDDRYEERYDDRRYDDRRGDRDRYDRDDRRDGGININIRFGDDDRRAIYDYYGDQRRSGHCPPGLAKKGNGCLPPGQARKWQRGYALPQDIRYYPIPGDLRGRLPRPPAGYDYVRIGADVLMIAVGTRMVVDAIEDILR